MTLEHLGWDQFFSEHFGEFADRGYSAGRVALEHKNRYEIYFEEGCIAGELAGKMRYQASSAGELPAVGDWVAMSVIDGERRAIVHGVLPRRSSFSRKAVGGATEEQVVAANIDTVFLVTGLDGNFNLRRIERYLTLAWESGANPVVVLNKADLCENLEECVADAEAVSLGVPVIAVSATGEEGLERLEAYMQSGKTVALLGSSGVGKSTLTNRLAGEDLQDVGEVSGSVGKGKHTTTHRELIVLPSGGMLIDTPGMREIGLWSAGEGLQETFEDIERLASDCRFRDCTHANEPGCAVRQAIDDGELDADRLHNYEKMGREIAYLERRHDAVARQTELRKWKQITKEMRRNKK
jgi:ribosome biogenesis GTPase